MKRTNRIYHLLKALFGYDFLLKSRRQHIIDARAVYFYYLYTYENMNLAKIQRHTEMICGRKFNHATILHSVRNYPIYAKYNQLMPKYLSTLAERLSPAKNKVVFIKTAVDFLKQDTIDEIYPKVKEEYLKTLEIEVEGVG